MIQLFRATNFRCLESVEMSFSPRFNLISGVNASGKTSLLEALAYLGRGKSFRGASTGNLIKHGEAEFLLYGEIDADHGAFSVGVKNSIDGLEVRVGGEGTSGTSALAEALPLQIIDPEVHNLISGGPELRRRFLDWVVFHVEHNYLLVWRKYRRVLKQRNAALRSRSAESVIRSWNVEFLELAGLIDQSRKRVLELSMDSLHEYGYALLEAPLSFEYQQGWAHGKDLAVALEDNLERDFHLGGTQLGPHRGDIKVGYSEHQARKLVSRGQQKLLASAMVLAATETAQASLERPLLLLLDDPAAELDGDSVDRLITSVAALGCQVIATTLDSTALMFPEKPKMFHVEQGLVTTAS
ncbi:MAG: DNA replication/repair protein RecF [Woeseiaceae bacterium]|nr:DNA replication/repair protein RecF [Woeseiaceae bacterium]